MITIIRRLDARLRAMLAATALLVVPQVGQLTAIRDLNTNGHESGLTFVFLAAGIFFVPTSFIVSVAILLTVRRHWLQHHGLIVLGILNCLMALNLVWFFAAACSWAHVIGTTLKTCQ